METYILKHHQVFVDYTSERENDSKKVFKVSIKMLDQEDYKEFGATFPITLFSSKLGDVKKMISRFFSGIPNYSLSVKKEKTNLTLYFRVSLEDIVMKEVELQLPCTRELSEVEQLRLRVLELKECTALHIQECAVAHLKISELEAKNAKLEDWKRGVDETLKHIRKMQRYFLNIHMHMRLANNPGGIVQALQNGHYQYSPTPWITINSNPINSEKVVFNGDLFAQITPFYNLKRVEAHTVTTLGGTVNEFVEELFLHSCPGIKDLRGIEGMPNLKSISFDNCPALNPSHLFEIEHQITELYERGCPMILTLKDELKIHGITYKPFV